MRRLLVTVVVWSCAAGAGAQEPLTENDYAIDLVQTPVLGSGRIVGLGGAYTALADGIDGAPWNPAAYGSRTLWELDYFEWELTAGILFPGAFAEADFFNRHGERYRFGGFGFLSLGFRLQFGDVGFGNLVNIQFYDLKAPTGQTVRANFIVGRYGMAWQLLNGQVVVGIGARTADLAITAPATATELVRFTGTGPEVGVLLKLEDRPWRLGVAARSAVSSEEIHCPGKGDGCDEDGDGIQEAEGFVLPNDVHMPWELQVGFAVQIGNRPLNRRWIDPAIEERRLTDQVTMARWQREREQVHREMRARGEPIPSTTDPYRWLPRRPRDPAFWAREQYVRAQEDAALEARIEAAEDAADREVEQLPRSYVLLTADLLVTGRTLDGVGIEGFLGQQRQDSGDQVTYAVRFGVETEPWQGRLKVRAGTYLEPSRFRTGTYRVHGTGGFDLRLFRWDLFGLFDDFDVRAGATIDVAPRYLDWGIGVGFWH